jgi:hypothetical protein
MKSENIFTASICMILFATQISFSQSGVGINSTGVAPDGSAMLDVKSTTKGMLVPRMLAAERTAIVSPATGLLVYQTDAPEGFYFKAATGWQLIGNGTLTGSGTATRVAFWDAASSISCSSNLNWDNINSRLGIGVNAPEFKLSLDNDGGILAKGTLQYGTILTTSGYGTRMIWYPRKAAFRAGVVTGTQWDDANIGEGSFASGFSTIASGTASTATGHENTASGNYSTVMGYGSNASGTNARAMGLFNNASGNYSTVMGVSSVSSGTNSTAIGQVAVASGNYSTAIGNFASTNAKSGSFVLGDNSTITSLLSSADNQFSARFDGGYRFFSDVATTNANGMFFKGGKMGIGVDAPEFKLSLNDDGGILAKGTIGSGDSLTTAGEGTRMIWYPKKAAFRAGVAFGSEWNDINIGNASVAFGGLTKASGTGATAMGVQTTASGDYSTALGANTVASGNFSTAMGDYSVASGNNSTAIGNSATASGENSIAMGNAVSTDGFYGSLVMGDGFYTPLNSTTSNQFSARFINGFRFFSSDPAYAYLGMYFTNGNLGIGVASPQAKLHVEGDALVNGGQLYITMPDGLAPMVITSTTLVPNLHVATAELAITATTATNFSGNLAGDVGGTQSATSVNKLKGVNVSATTPTNTQVLTYNSSSSQWEPQAHMTGTGTSAQVAFWSGTSSLSSNSNLYWDNTNTRLGIGTSTPNLPLTVRTATTTANAPVTSLANAITDPLFQLIATRGATTNNTGDVTTAIGQAYSDNVLTEAIRFHRGSAANNGTISFTTNSTEKMRITTAGTVQIGTTGLPSGKLQVVGLSVFADNAAALAGGLLVGAFYRTATGVVMVVF